MKRKQKREYKKRRSWGWLVIVIVLFLAGGYMLSSWLIPPYQIEDRIPNMKKIEKAEKDKVIGWLRVQGTNIDMPVIYRDEDTDVTKMDYDFAWSYPKTETLQNRAIFTSHNVLNVSSNPLLENEKFRRFESLPAFLYSEFAEKNQFIQYSVDGKNYLYQIFSVSIIKESSIDYDHDSFEQDVMKKYIKKAKQESYYDYDIDVDETDSIVTLITCTRFFGATDAYSLKIEARKIREYERAKQVALKVKSNYQEIDERMKEGVENEVA